jgi:hypothetical protein
MAEAEMETKEKTDNKEDKRHLAEYVKCTICCTWMLTKIFGCPTGHVWCERCNTKIPKCPTCQHRQKVRYILLEKLGNEFVLDCMFCSAYSARREELQRHIRHCPARPLHVCDFFDDSEKQCPFEDKANVVAEHLVAEHSVIVCESQSQLVPLQVTKTESSTILVSCKSPIADEKHPYGHFVVVHIFWDVTDLQWKICLRSLCRCEKHPVLVKVQEKKEGKTIKWRCFCQGVLDSFYRLWIADEQILGLPRGFLEKQPFEFDISISLEDWRGQKRKREEGEGEGAGEGAGAAKREGHAQKKVKFNMIANNQGEEA